jgi:hypothetical protein
LLFECNLRRYAEYDAVAAHLDECKAKVAACDRDAAALAKTKTRLERAADADAMVGLCKQRVPLTISPYE